MGNVPCQKEENASSKTQKGNSMTSFQTQKTSLTKNTNRIPRVSSFNKGSLNLNNSNTINSSSSSFRRSSRFQSKLSNDSNSNNNNNISADSTRIGSKLIDKNEINFTISILQKHCLFVPYIDNEYIKNNIIKQLNRSVVKSGAVVYKKGDEPDAMFILYKGKLSITGVDNNTMDIYNNEIDQTNLIYGNNNNNNNSSYSYDSCFIAKEINVGEVFGEYDVINNTPRQVNITNQQPNDAIVIIINKDLLLSITTIVRKKTQDRINTFFNTNYPFILPYESIKKNLITDAITILTYNQDDIIPYEGNCLYIITKGEISTVYNNEIAKNLRKGDIIGHRELIYQSTPNITLQSKTECELIHISRNKLISLLGKNNYIDNITFFIFALCFNRSNSLHVIDVPTLIKLFPLFSIECYNPNEIVFSKGDCLNEEVVILLEGNISKPNATHYEAMRSEFLYEKELILNEHSVLIIEDLHVYPEGIIMRCDNEKIKSVLNGNTLKDIVYKTNKKKTCHNLTLELLKQCGISNINTVISKVKVKEMEKGIEIVKFSSNVTIIKEGDSNLNQLYIIKSGYVGIYINNKFIRTLGPGSPFGFKALLMDIPNRTATAITHGPCEILSINAKLFMSTVMIDAVPQVGMYLRNRTYLEDERLTLNDIEHIRLLGKGSFGIVSLVRHKKQKCLYAIKAIPVLKVIQYDIYELILNERNILKMLDHNFLMKNCTSLKNNEFVFLINEYIRGKTLHRLLKDSGTFIKQQTQFYIASLIIVIKYLHSNYFIHRDIKPENIMLNYTGYIKLIDFGTVKETSSKNGTARTIIGTPHYMAPEVMKGESYNFSVDYWSVGICLYEFVFGKVPFGADQKDPNEIYKTVNNYIEGKINIKYPSQYKDNDLMNLLSKILSRNSNDRIKPDEIMEHKWFEGFDWKGLKEMNITVPYKPGGNDIDDLNSKGSNYIAALKTFMSNNINNSKQMKELTKWDYEKGDKWLKDF